MRALPVPSAYSAYPAIRAVGPPDAPFEGVLARGAGDGTVLLVDRNLLRDWPAWRAPGDTHVLAPLDVVRRKDGHDIVLPAVADRLDRLVARRGGAGAPVSDGEALTVAVSVLRGVVTALTEELDGETASWWVTVEGKPVLVCGSGESDAVRASQELVAGLAETVADPRLRDVLDDFRDALTQPRVLPRNADRWEDALFAVVEAEPLMTEVIGPVRPPTIPAADTVAGGEPEGLRREWWSSLAVAADSGLAASAFDLMHRIRVRMTSRGRKVRPVAWVAGLAAVVLVVGLSWPEPSGPHAALGAEKPVPSTPASASPVAPDAEASTGSGDQPADAAEALRGLLDARAACPDAPCRALAQEDQGKTLPPGAVDAEQRTIALLDDFGGLAVLRVDAPGELSQFVTVVTTPGGWRIRDAFDVADPPA